jgi:hypothetical protein
MNRLTLCLRPAAAAAVVLAGAAVAAGPAALPATASAAPRAFAPASGRAVAAWGQNDRGQLGNGSGSVLAWGDNGNGQLGTGLRQDHSTLPEHVRLPDFGRAVAVGGGCVHSVAVTARGQLLAWGSGTLLGNGGQAPSSVPVAVRLPAGQIAIGTGGNSDADFSLAVLKPAA